MHSGFGPPTSISNQNEVTGQTDCLPIDSPTLTLSCVKLTAKPRTRITALHLDLSEFFFMIGFLNFHNSPHAKMSFPWWVHPSPSIVNEPPPNVDSHCHLLSACICTLAIWTGCSWLVAMVWLILAGLAPTSPISWEVNRAAWNIWAHIHTESLGLFPWKWWRYQENRIEAVRSLEVRIWDKYAIEFGPWTK